MSKVFYQHKITRKGATYPNYSNNLDKTLAWLERRKASGATNFAEWKVESKGYEVEEEAL